MSPAMATSGFLQSSLAGRHIGTAIGHGKTTMAGPGSAPILGAGRPITTGVGSTGRRAGAGILGPLTIITIGHPRWWLSSDLAATIQGSVSDSDSVMSVGSRLGHASRSILGGAGEAD